MIFFVHYAYVRTRKYMVSMNLFSFCQFTLVDILTLSLIVFFVSLVSRPYVI